MATLRVEQLEERNLMSADLATVLEIALVIDPATSVYAAELVPGGQSLFTGSQSEYSIMSTTKPLTTSYETYGLATTVPSIYGFGRHRGVVTANWA